MSIASSSYVVEPAQVDGRCFVREEHTDHLGAVHVFTYLAAVDTDYAAQLAARVPQIEDSLAVLEYHACLDSDTLTTEHITKGEFVARFREAYRSADREEAARLATWLANRVQAGDITPAQVQSAFGLTPAQYVALRDRALALRDHWLAVQAAKGE